MGRSVSYPTGSVAAFRLLDDGEEDDVDWAYECLVDEIIDTTRAAFPSFETFDGWRAREDRILLRNAFADCGISTYCGLAAIWLAPRDDARFWEADFYHPRAPLDRPGSAAFRTNVRRAETGRALLEWRGDLGAAKFLHMKEKYVYLANKRIGYGDEATRIATR